MPDSQERQYRIQLNPDNRPAQLGVDIVCLSGMHAPVTVSLLAGDRMVAENLLQLELNSGYIQMTTQMLVPLQDHPEADTVLLLIGSWRAGPPSVVAPATQGGLAGGRAGHGAARDRRGG